MTDPTDGRELHILRELLADVRAEAVYPLVQPFRVKHEDDRDTIDRLIESGAIRPEGGRYVLRLAALERLDENDAELELEQARRVLTALQHLYREDPSVEVTPALVSKRAKLALGTVERALSLIEELPIWRTLDFASGSGWLQRGYLKEAVLECGLDEFEPPLVTAPGLDPLALVRLTVAGYRPLRSISLDLDGLTIIVGANGAGKSSLFDFLDFVCRSAQVPIPPEIDSKSPATRLFHDGRPERIAFSPGFDLGARPPLRYEVELLGPIGRPVVAHERLSVTEIFGPRAGQDQVLLEFRAGKGKIEESARSSGARDVLWNIPPNELALRRALDPGLTTTAAVRRQIVSWRFYHRFGIGSGAAIRRPVPSEPDPELAEDGSNLSAVLLWLLTRHRPVFDEIESVLRSVVPGFVTLNVLPTGGPGTVVGEWHEEGLSEPLSFADLSDGTLRFLCLAVACLAPSSAGLICIDEPEVGLHPRVLPILADLLRRGAEQRQLLVATHSPYLLAQFELDEIAVMRKVDGASEIVRPATSTALREMTAEFGGDVLTRLYLSDELELLP